MAEFIPKTAYRADRQGVGALMKSADMERMLKSAARKGKTFAEGIAPRRTGEYAASFRVSSSRTGGVSRAMAALWNDDPAAIYIEVTDDYHVLARAKTYIEETGP